MTQETLYFNCEAVAPGFLGCQEQAVLDTENRLIRQGIRPSVSTRGKCCKYEGCGGSNICDKHFEISYEEPE